MSRNGSVPGCCKPHRSFLWIVERCLAKDPKQRYASTQDLARDLAAVRDRLAEASPRLRSLAPATCRCSALRSLGANAKRQLSASS